MTPSHTVKPPRSDTRLLSRLVVLMFAIVVIAAVAFGIYYYSDRYVHLGDKSPVELGIEHLEKIVADNPEDLGARLSLAQFHYDDGNYSEAIFHAQRVLKVSPEEPGPLFLLGLAYTESGHLEVAVATLEQLADIRRESSMAHVDQVLEATLYYLGRNYVQLERYDQAIQAFEEALEINPSDADALYQLGVAYTRNREHELAIEPFQKAVRLVPNFTEAYQGMAEAYSALGRPEYVRYAQGMVFFSDEEYEQARHDLELAASKLPVFAGVHLGLAMAYEELGEIQLAKDSVLRAMQLEPDNFNAKIVHGRIQSIEGDS